MKSEVGGYEVEFTALTEGSIIAAKTAPDLHYPSRWKMLKERVLIDENVPPSNDFGCKYSVHRNLTDDRNRLNIFN
ncbi:4683_t:CDS:2 [Diversispora eburnea]|uniref:4683_t:CDS:1 n=1 Tax=Diversispora eburnea TaxID=1213867 RepID=A0A9N8VEM4_9GLOM|nr:4683_t:CDS:2 [Diversispora eburnea]